MVHESVLDVIHDASDDDDSDYEDGYEDEDDEEAGQLQSGFKAMDITSTTREEGSHNLGGEGSVLTDARIQELEQPGKSAKKKKKKRRGKGERRKQSAPRMSIEQFVVQTCRRIEETKYPLFREAVDRIGIDAMKALLNQVDVIEKCGGQMTADGLRRRSAGGVLWSLLRDHVGPGLYKEIMKEGNRKHIEQQKSKFKEREKERGNGKRQHMDVVAEGDERQNSKRRRTCVDVDGPPAGRSVSRERLPRASLREEVDNVRTPAALQNAWIQGLKKHSERGDVILNPKPSEGKGPNPTGMKRPVSERLRMTVSYSDLVEEGQIATDSPIRGVTEVGETGVEEGECRGEVNDELDNVREEGEMEEGELVD